MFALSNVNPTELKTRLCTTQLTEQNQQKPDVHDKVLVSLHSRGIHSIQTETEKQTSYNKNNLHLNYAPVLVTQPLVYHSSILCLLCTTQRQENLIVTMFKSKVKLSHYTP
jgi:hypothetical protein